MFKCRNNPSSFCGCLALYLQTLAEVNVLIPFHMSTSSEWTLMMQEGLICGQTLNLSSFGCAVYLATHAEKTTMSGKDHGFWPVSRNRATHRLALRCFKMLQTFRSSKNPSKTRRAFFRARSLATWFIKPPSWLLGPLWWAPPACVLAAKNQRCQDGFRWERPNIFGAFWGHEN